ncbi:hypothetical protein MUN79_06830 [Hymenobacter cellulosilyticus]|uniref:Delta-60 repeat domain-containing protein n=1 Tax=Hymenobacter cellulosilyticus TaxID=2932248 RepID=A0A8T9Q805_9BACT|nr:hypothetical protein [Hymenobacter cellulosilyticus]UOQ73634.1 hypothetical protein MUN79_06830 [Hymenobacter cellulosilyticus]
MFFLHRLSATGTADAAYQAAIGTGPGQNGIVPRVNVIASLPDGKHYVAGLFNQFNSVGAPALLRLNANGTRDNTFVPSLSNTSMARVLPLASGKVLVTGVNTNGQSNNLARLTATSGLDATFAAGINSFSQFALAELPNGRILVGAARWYPAARPAARWCASIPTVQLTIRLSTPLVQPARPSIRWPCSPMAPSWWRAISRR